MPVCGANTVDAQDHLSCLTCLLFLCPAAGCVFADRGPEALFTLVSQGSASLSHSFVSDTNVQKMITGRFFSRLSDWDTVELDFLHRSHRHPLRPVEQRMDDFTTLIPGDSSFPISPYFLLFGFHSGRFYFVL